MVAGNGNKMGDGDGDGDGYGWGWRRRRKLRDTTRLEYLEQYMVQNVDVLCIHKLHNLSASWRMHFNENSLTLFQVI